VAEFTLIPEPPLEGYVSTFGETTLNVPKDLAIVSIALPLGGEKDALDAIKSAYGCDLPEAGKAVLAKESGFTFMRLAKDQAFVLFTYAKPNAIDIIEAQLKGAAYLTDQTDVWFALQLAGQDARRALERICPIDVHPNHFEVHDCARTIMEHLGAVILRTAHDEYLLMSASSSAGSFLHAVEISLKNVV